MPCSVPTATPRWGCSARHQPDLVLLDLMLPGKDGVQVCREIRAESGVPIIMLTAKSDTLDVVVGLESGADDYVSKPFKPKELVARIKARLRRSEDPGPERLAVGDVEIDVTGHTVMRDGERIALTPLEFDLLVALARKPWQVFTREVLLERVWGYRHSADTRLVNVHVQRLRSKIERDPENPEIVLDGARRRLQGGRDTLMPHGLVTRLRRAVHRARVVSVRFTRRTVAQWRSSMQLRVVTTALAIGLAAIVVLGLYLSTSVRDGIYEQRLAAINREAAKLTEQVSQNFADTTTTSDGDLQILLKDSIASLASTGGSTAEEYFLLHELGTTVRVSDIVSRSDLTDVVITTEVREANLASDDDQVLQAVGIPSRDADGMVRPGVIVGSTVQAAPGARYEIYYLYSLEPEQETLSFVHRVLLAGGFGMLALLGVVTWTMARQTVTPVTPRRDRGGAPRRGAPLRTDARRQGYRRDGEPRALVQRDGREPPGPDPAHGGALRHAAPVRLRRVARAAHPAHDHPDGERDHPRVQAPDGRGRRPLRRAAPRPDRPVRVAAGRPAGDQPVRRRRRGPRRRAPRPARRGHVGRGAGRAAREDQGRAGLGAAARRRRARQTSTPAGSSASCATSWSTRSSTPRSGRSR